MKPDVSVQTPTQRYPIYVRSTFPGTELQRHLNRFTPGKKFLIIDENVEKIHGKTLKAAIGETSSEILTYIVPAGESSKGLEQWNKITDFLLTGGVRRNNLVIAAGGGVTGDLAGFAASTALRGLPLIHIPTTLLSMVDSSIGGKTGINHKTGKNLIGTFYQPEAIFIHTGFLSTLPQKEWINGLSEILKYGSIKDPSIFSACERLFLDSHDPAEYPDTELVELIRKCAKIKADIVAADEKESGIRMHLNFGHTFAHALESKGGYQSISHGEAVFTGMIAALSLSSRTGSSIKTGNLEKFRTLYNINPEVFSYPVDQLVQIMHFDKKKSSEKLKVVLLQDWGQPTVTELQDTAAVADAWQDAFELFISGK